MGRFCARSCPKAGSCLPQPPSLNAWQGCGCGLARPCAAAARFGQRKNGPHATQFSERCTCCERWAERSQVLSSAGTGSAWPKALGQGGLPQRVQRRSSMPTINRAKNAWQRAAWAAFTHAAARRRAAACRSLPLRTLGRAVGVVLHVPALQLPALVNEKTAHTRHNSANVVHAANVGQSGRKS